MSAPLLELENVTVVRGGRRALDGINLTIPAGQNVAILGPNGCGKSTLVKLIDRELYPRANEGSLRILGRERWLVSELRAALGIVTNDLQAAIDPETTALNAVVSGFTGKLGVYWDEGTEERFAAAQVALDAAGAGAFAERAVGTLSSGEARRVLIARALAHDPGALLFDEPTTSLDIVSAHALMGTLRRLATGEKPKSIVLVTHHLEEIIPEIDRVIMLKRGHILLDGPREEVMTADNLSELFETAISLSGDGPYSARVRD